jgi:hypothetical protein
LFIASVTSRSRSVFASWCASAGSRDAVIEPSSPRGLSSSTFLMLDPRLIETGGVGRGPRFSRLRVGGEPVRASLVTSGSEFGWLFARIFAGEAEGQSG